MGESYSKDVSGLTILQVLSGGVMDLCGVLDSSGNNYLIFVYFFQDYCYKVVTFGIKYIILAKDIDLYLEIIY